MIHLFKRRWLRSAVYVGKFLRLTFGSNYSVNSLLADTYRQMSNFGDECKALMDIVPENCNDLDLLHRAGETAAFAGDVDSLKILRDLAGPISPPFVCYLDGLLAFQNNNLDYHRHFQDSVRTYFRLEGAISFDTPDESIPDVMKRVIKSGRPIPEFVRMAYNFRGIESLDALMSLNKLPITMSLLPGDLVATPDLTLGPNEPGPIILISCSHGYLEVFADYYIRQSRKRNKNIVHFHVLTENVSETRHALLKIAAKYPNIGYSIEPICGVPQVYFTLARFLVCRELMAHYKRDVHISDIDVNPDLDINSLAQEFVSKGYDFGLCDAGYQVPWAKYSVGFSYFRVENNATDIYLGLLSKHLSALYADGAFFSLDQVGALLVYDYMQARGLKCKMLNLFELIDFNKLCAVPRTLQLNKINCKFGSGAPQ